MRPLHLPRILLFVASLASSALFTQGEPSDPEPSAEAMCLKVIEQIDALREAAAADQDESDPNKRSRIYNDPLLQLSQQLRERMLPDIRKEEWNQPRLLLQKHIPLVTDPALKQSLEALLKRVLQEKADQKTRLIDRYAIFEASIQRDLLGYNEPAQLDAPLMELNDLDRDIETVPYWDNGEKPPVHSMRPILTNWQEYLYYRQLGNRREIETRLRNLENQLARYNLVPRSAVLALKNQIAPAQVEHAVFAELKTIMQGLDGEATYQPILLQLRELYQRSDRNHKVSIYVGMLEKLDGALQAIVNDSPGTALSLLNAVEHTSAFGKDPRVLHERDWLRLQALSLRLPPELRATQSETAQAFVDRVGTALGEQSQWMLLRTFLGRVKNGRLMPNDMWPYNEERTTARLISGKRYEDVGQYVTAYNLYAGVIESESRFSQHTGAQAGIRRIIAVDPDVALRSRLEREKLEAVRQSIEQARHHGAPFGHGMEQQGLEELIKETAREQIAMVIGTSTQAVDPFAPKGASTIKQEAQGERFRVTYLSDKENEITQTFTDFNQEGQSSLRLIDDQRMPLDRVASIQVTNPLPLEEMNKWPKRFGSGLKIPRTQIIVKLTDGSQQIREVYSTLYWSFHDSTGTAERVKMHPCRFLLIERVQ